MASEHQIAANRQNAKRSTGPQTVAGKRRSSRNALKHGLAHSGERSDARIQDLAALIASVLDSQDSIERALALAGTKFRLAEVRRVRNEMLTTFLEAPFDSNIRAIYSLGRYDRAAFTQHKRAIRLLCSKSE